MDLTSRPEQNPDTAARTIDDAMYVLDPETSRLHAFNEVGARIWELLDGRRDLAAIAALIAAEYQADPAVIEADVLEFAALLDEKGLIRS